MEFDADWILPAIVVAVMLVRGIGSRIARATKKSTPRTPEQPKPVRQAPSSGFEISEAGRVEGQPKPIEPR